jgi:uncharacterized beta-barrel protein YwiB (DUF1934 family)
MVGIKACDNTKCVQQRELRLAMTKVKINFTSTIVQEKERETFEKIGVGDLQKNGEVTRISYLEDNTVPVKVLIKQHDVIIKRGNDQDNYSLLHFVLGEEKACRYVAQGYQMDLKSITNLLKFFSKNDGSQELRIEYDLFSGLYLIGNYTVTLIFT